MPGHPLQYGTTKEFLESLIDASVDAIIAADLKGKILLFNKGAERIYGFKQPEVVGKARSSRPAIGSQIRTVASLLSEIRRLPSGLQSMDTVGEV